MYITSATPSELLSWFHNNKEDQKVLCVLLAPKNEDQVNLTKIISDIYKVDALLGKSVALMLLHPKIHTPMSIEFKGKFEAFSGTTFPSSDFQPDFMPLKHTSPFRDWSSESEWAREEIVKQAVRATASFVPDFMDMFDVTYEQLPVLCVSVRGIEDCAIIPLGKWSKASLHSLLGSIRNIADNASTFSNSFKTLADSVPPLFVNIQEIQNKIQKKEKQVCKILDRILRHNNAQPSDHILIADYVARGMPESEPLEVKFSECTFNTVEKLRGKEGIPKAIELVKEIAELNSRTSQHGIRQFVLSIEEQAKKLISERSQVLNEIKQLQNARIENAHQGENFGMSRLRKHLETINLTGDLGEKLSIATGLVGKLIN